MPVNFHGTLLIRPGVASFVTNITLRGNGATQSGRIGLIGPAAGGQTNTALTFRSAPEAEALLISGRLLDGIKRAFDEGASEIVAVAVGGGSGGTSATQSTANIVDAASANTITLTTVGYGAWTLGILWKIEAATTNGHKVTTKYNGLIISQDNVYRESLSVQYTGLGTPATLAVSASGIVTACTGATSDNVALSFSNYPTIQKMADALAANGKYTVTIKHPNPNANSADLDYLAATDVLTAPLVLKSNTKEVIDWFNSGAQPWITAAYHATSTHKPPVASSTYAGLTGGVIGGTTLTDYTNAMDVLLPEDVQLVGVMSEDGTYSSQTGIHSALKTHVELASSTGYGHERHAVVGGAAGETLTQVIQRLPTLASPRVIFCWPGIQDVDDTGKKVTLSPMYVASSVLGVLANAKDPATPITGSSISSLGFESVANTPTKSMIETGIMAGLLMLERNPNGGVKISQARTTYTAEPDNLAKTEISTGRAADFVVRSVRNAVAPLVAAKGGSSLLTQARALVENTLKNLSSAEIIVGDETSPAYRNVQIVRSGQKILIAFEASPAIPANFILIEAYLTTQAG